ncbi:MAG TPA: FAD-dependent oxidoreductase [Candidatus Acidoferrum sp.]|nr:FAD-dependent oxidoreductase [Candidatus Acidoferrum sp.]
MKPRVDALRTIANEPFDVCVIGGGATGAGCALDAQLRGFKTVLIDASDFASGASSASTKMVHGGVRYLEQAVRRVDLAEYNVVKRALRERLHMLRNAPFLTGTREFITPCYSWRDVTYYGIGLKLYDWIAGSAGLAPSRFLSRDEALRRIPALNPAGLVGAVAYTDGQFDDARYNIALIETFAEAGGEPLNYARVVGFSKDAGGKITAAEIEDTAPGRRFTIRAGAFLNATGAFTDSVRRMAAPGVSPRMRPSRGVHILLPLEILSSEVSGGSKSEQDALLIPKTEDGRVLFAIPWLGRLLVGTTDEPVDRPEPVDISRDEIEYLLRHLNRYLRSRVTRDQIVSAFAGVRPLVSSGTSDKAPTKELARDHVVEVEEVSGLVSIMGGKWTTYRAMAEDAIDAVERRLSRPHVPCRTANHPLAGSHGFGADLWQKLVAEFCVPESAARHLTEKFGARAAHVLALTKENPALAAPLVARAIKPADSAKRFFVPESGAQNVKALGNAGPADSQTAAQSGAVAAIKAEVVFCARYEMAVSIEDVLARRVGLESYGWREALAAAPAVADLLAAELHWPEEYKRRAVDEPTRSKHHDQARSKRDAYVLRINDLLRSADC